MTLRPFGPDDADLLIELDSDPAVMRFLSGGEPTAPELIRTRDLPSILAGYDRWAGRFGLFAAFESATDSFLGWFALRPEADGPEDEVELGYRLRRPAWGQGYASEVSSALIDRAFTELDVHTVWGATMATNLGSQRVMEKVGMVVVEELATPDDMLAVEGADRGGYRYEITRDAWLALRHA